MNAWDSSEKKCSRQHVDIYDIHSLIFFQKSPENANYLCYRYISSFVFSVKLLFLHIIPVCAHSFFKTYCTALRGKKQWNCYLLTTVNSSPSWLEAVRRKTHALLWVLLQTEVKPLWALFWEVTVDVLKKRKTGVFSTKTLACWLMLPLMKNSLLFTIWLMLS